MFNSRYFNEINITKYAGDINSVYGNDDDDDKIKRTFDQSNININLSNSVVLNSVDNMDVSAEDKEEDLPEFENNACTLNLLARLNELKKTEEDKRHFQDIERKLRGPRPKTISCAAEIFFDRRRRRRKHHQNMFYCECSDCTDLLSENSCRGDSVNLNDFSGRNYDKQIASDINDRCNNGGSGSNMYKCYSLPDRLDEDCLSSTIGNDDVYSDDEDDELLKELRDLYIYRKQQHNDEAQHNKSSCNNNRNNTTNINDNHSSFAYVADRGQTILNNIQASMSKPVAVSTKRSKSFGKTGGTFIFNVDLSTEIGKLTNIATDSSQNDDPFDTMTTTGASDMFEKQNPAYIHSKVDEPSNKLITSTTFEKNTDCLSTEKEHMSDRNCPNEQSSVILTLNDTDDKIDDELSSIPVNSTSSISGPVEIGKAKVLDDDHITNEEYYNKRNGEIAENIKSSDSEHTLSKQNKYVISSIPGNIANLSSHNIKEMLLPPSNIVISNNDINDAKSCEISDHSKFEKNSITQEHYTESNENGVSIRAFSNVSASHSSFCGFLSNENEFAGINDKISDSNEEIHKEDIEESQFNKCKNHHSLHPLRDIKFPSFLKRSFLTGLTSAQPPTIQFGCDPPCSNVNPVKQEVYHQNQIVLRPDSSTNYDINFKLRKGDELDKKELGSSDYLYCASNSASLKKHDDDSLKKFKSVYSDCFELFTDPKNNGHRVSLSDEKIVKRRYCHNYPNAFTSKNGEYKFASYYKSRPLMSRLSQNKDESSSSVDNADYVNSNADHYKYIASKTQVMPRLRSCEDIDDYVNAQNKNYIHSNKTNKSNKEPIYQEKQVNIGNNAVMVSLSQTALDRKITNDNYISLTKFQQGHPSILSSQQSSSPQTSSPSVLSLYRSNNVPRQSSSSSNYSIKLTKNNILTPERRFIVAHIVDTSRNSWPDNHSLSDPLLSRNTIQQQSGSASILTKSLNNEGFQDADVISNLLDLNSNRLERKKRIDTYTRQLKELWTTSKRSNESPKSPIQFAPLVDNDESNENNKLTDDNATNLIRKWNRLQQRCSLVEQVGRTRAVILDLEAEVHQISSNISDGLDVSDDDTLSMKFKLLREARLKFDELEFNLIEMESKYNAQEKHHLRLLNKSAFDNSPKSVIKCGNSSSVESSNNTLIDTSAMTLPSQIYKYNNQHMSTINNFDQYINRKQPPCSPSHSNFITGAYSTDPQPPYRLSRTCKATKSIAPTIHQQHYHHNPNSSTSHFKNYLYEKLKHEQRQLHLIEETMRMLQSGLYPSIRKPSNLSDLHYSKLLHLPDINIKYNRLINNEGNRIERRSIESQSYQTSNIKDPSGDLTSSRIASLKSDRCDAARTFSNAGDNDYDCLGVTTTTTSSAATNVKQHLLKVDRDLSDRLTPSSLQAASCSISCSVSPVEFSTCSTGEQSNANNDMTANNGKSSEDISGQGRLQTHQNLNDFILTPFPNASDVQLRATRSFSKQERPLTRYLPLPGLDLDLRQHIENAGHILEHNCKYIHLTKTTCCGYLVKMGQRFRTWHKRWFVFDRNRRTFSYYNTQSSETKGQCRGQTNFQSICEVYVDHLNFVKSPAPRSTFVVKTILRTFYLVAPSAENMRIWIDVLITGAEGHLEYQD